MSCIAKYIGEVSAIPDDEGFYYLEGKTNWGSDGTGFGACFFENSSQSGEFDSECYTPDGVCYYCEERENRLDYWVVNMPTLDYFKHEMFYVAFDTTTPPGYNAV